MPRRPIPRLPVEVTVDTEVPSRDPDRRSDRLRYEAMAIYVCHPDGITLEELAEDPRFLGWVPYETLRGWCADDGWTEQRKKVLAQFGDKIKAEFQKALYSRIAQVRIEQLDTVKTMKADLFSKLLNTEARSAEGAAKAILDLMKHELELSQTVGKELMPGSGGGSIEARDNLTDEEVLAASRIILAQRRKALSSGGADVTEAQSGKAPGRGE